MITIELIKNKRRLNKTSSTYLVMNAGPHQNTAPIQSAMVEHKTSHFDIFSTPIYSDSGRNSPLTAGIHEIAQHRLSAVIRIDSCEGDQPGKSVNGYEWTEEQIEQKH